jgi:hypothetical protein
VQVDPIKPTLKASKSKFLKLEHEKVLSDYAFNFNLRRYSMRESFAAGAAQEEAALEQVTQRAAEEVAKHAGGLEHDSLGPNQREELLLAQLNECRMQLEAGAYTCPLFCST